jgi:hypothetical protein
VLTRLGDGMSGGMSDVEGRSRSSAEVGRSADFFVRCVNLLHTRNYRITDSPDSFAVSDIPFLDVVSRSGFLCVMC